MSKNSKNRRLHAEAKQWSSRRKGGGKGPAQTIKKNKKVKTWWRKSADERARQLKKVREGEGDDNN